MAITKEKWERVKNYYEAGLTLSQIKDKTGVDRSTISKKAKNQQWQHGANTDYIVAKTIIAQKKSTENQQSINILDEIADERTSDIKLFRNSALMAQNLSNKAISTIDPDEVQISDLNALEAHSRITQRNKDTVLGKDKTVELNNVNAQTTNKITYTRIKVGD